MPEAVRVYHPSYYARVRRRRRGRVVALVAAAVTAAMPLVAWATDYYWVNGGGGWLDSADHWSLMPGGPPGASVPGAGDNAIIIGTNATNFTVAYASASGSN